MRPQQIIHRIRARIRPPGDDSDSELLRRFISSNDQSAFAKLLDRYAGLVMGVCRRTVGEAHLAEDVFQATFLVLSKKAASLRQTTSLPAWLHRVAFRLALRHRKSARINKEHGVPIESLSASPLDDLSARELLAILDEELNRLGDTHRSALILCCLEGHSVEEAAALLGCSPGAIKGRLERGRSRLRDRLTKRGLALSAVLGMPLIMATANEVSARAKSSALTSLAAGHSLSPNVSGLVEAFMHSSFAKIKVIGLSFALLFAVGAGMMLNARQPAKELKPSLPPKVATGPETKSDANPDQKKDLHGDPLPEGAVLRLGTIQRRAVGAQFIVTPDGKSIISVRGGKYLTIWDADTGRLREARTLPFKAGYQSWMHRLSPDGRWLAADSGNSSRLLLVNLQTGKSEHEFTINDSRRFNSIGWSPRGDRIAALGFVKKQEVVKVWDIATGKELLSQAVTTQNSNNFVAFTPDGKAVIADFASEDVGLMCWEIETNKVRWKSKGQYANFALFTPDGQFMLTRSLPAIHNAINVITGQPAKLEHLPPFEWDSRVRFFPDGKRVGISKEGGVSIWDTEKGQEARFLKGAGEEFLITPDGKSIVTNDGSLQRWNLETGKPVYPDTFGLGHIHEVIAVKFSADGKRVVSASKDGTVRLWDAVGGKPLRVWTGHEAFRPSPVMKWAEAGVQALDISPDGHWIVSAGSEEKLIVRDAESGESRTIDLPKREGNEGERRIYQLRVSPDGREAVAHFGATSHFWSTGQPFVQPSDKLMAWDLITGATTKTTRIKSGGRGDDMTTNRRYLVQAGEVIDIATSKEVAHLDGASKATNSPNPNGPCVSSSEGTRIIGTIVKREEKNGQTYVNFGGLRIWETVTGKTIADLALKTWVGQAGFHPYLRLAFTSDYDGIALWDLATKKMLHRFVMPETIHSSTTSGTYASCVAFSRDGKRMATGHPDGTILVWDVPISLAPMTPVAANDVDSLWAELESSSAAKAWQAMWRLAESPDQAISLLRKRLKPVEIKTLEKLAPLIADLDSDEFARREQAMKKLAELGPRAEAAFRKASRGKLSAEQQKRIDQLLASIAEPKVNWTPTELAEIRAVNLLEQIGTVDSARLLEELSQGAESARLTREAKDALERIRFVNR